MSHAETDALTVLVAEKVMGWRGVRKQAYGWFGIPPTGQYRCGLPDFAGDMTATWRVVEQMRRSYPLKLHIGMNGRTRAWFLPLGVQCESDDAPEAICRAALAALGVEVPE